MIDSSVRHAGHWRWDIRQDLVEVDDAARAVLGVTPDGRSLRFELLCQSIHPGDLPAFRAAIQVLVDGSQTEQALDCRIQTRWGEVSRLRLQARVLDRGPGGAALHIEGSFRRLEAAQQDPPGS